MKEVTWWNETLLFNNRPAGLELEVAKDYFSLTQAEALQQLKTRIKFKETENNSN